MGGRHDKPSDLRSAPKTTNSGTKTPAKASRLRLNSAPLRSADGSSGDATRKALRPTVKAPTGKASAKGGKTASRARVPEQPARAKPFVKWAGGKRQLLGKIHEHLPRTYGTYHEPFLGGGAVFFSLAPRGEAFLSDSNERLVRCYKGIQKNAKGVISLLKGYKRDRAFFERMREMDIDSAEDEEVAAWFIFLNKTGFNGLYRVNRKNRFNVPFGDSSQRQLFDEENLMACQRALSRATIECQDYQQVEQRARPGDLVYFDPPYLPLSATSSFTSYTARGFSENDHIALRDMALRLKDQGIHVLLSNSSPAAKFYERPSFRTVRVLATRQVNRNADGRGKIAELLIK